MEFPFELKENFSTLKIKRDLPEVLKEVTKKTYSSSTMSKAITITVSALTIPEVAFARDVFSDVWNVFAWIIDILAAAVIAIAGVSMMFGHRSKFIELMIGVSIGYLIARNALPIRDYLKSIGNGE